MVWYVIMVMTAEEEKGKKCLHLHLNDLYNLNPVGVLPLLIEMTFVLPLMILFNSFLHSFLLSFLGTEQKYI